MRLALTLHPDSRCTAATRIDVEVTRSGDGLLALGYFVTGDTTRLQIPPVTAPVRSDALWEHTCFEAFVRASSGTAYYELNFAPSTRWAAYRFSDYREGMRLAEEIGAPVIDVNADDERYSLRASLALGRIPDLSGDSTWRLGLAAVIEETGGRRSHWALAHPAARADFHHSDCFALELPAAWRP